MTDFIKALLPSAVREAGTANSIDIGGNPHMKGAAFLVDVSDETGGGNWNLAVHVQAKDTISGNYVDIGNAALDQVDGAGTYYLTIYPTVGADVDLPMPRVWRASAVLSGDATAEVQEITITGLGAGDEFTLTTETNVTIPFVHGVNVDAAALQAELRTATGDAALTVGGNDGGPYTVTFVETTAQDLITVQGTGCTGVSVVTTKGGDVLEYSVSVQRLS